VLEQATNAAAHPNVHGVALMADNHLGYAVPIGSVVAYRNAVSPSGVGYDIGCGVKAIKTDLSAADVRDHNLVEVLEEIQATVEFGVGRSSGKNIDHPVMDDPLWQDVPPEIQSMKQAASQQLGTVGAGNHYVDILVEEERDSLGRPKSYEVNSPVWIACHFGSRGLGHKTATHFLREGGAKDGIMEIPLVFTDDQPIFHDYVNSMDLAGAYAKAGRDIVLQQVLEILGAKGTYEVHNHHNFAWLEMHDEPLWIVRKGATPARVPLYGPDGPMVGTGCEGFVGGSMGDIAAIVQGQQAQDNQNSAAYYSTVHGAGRIHSRTWAKGKRNRKTGEQKTKGNVTRQMMSEATKEFGVVVRGGDVDESPFVYRKLEGVLEAQGDTIKVTHKLRPIGVVMAGGDTYDPFKD
jgi:tRNA-splicing ligase RtcB